LKGQGFPYSVNIETFTSQSGAAGTIPASSTVSFAIWMKETASVSGIFPSFNLSYLAAGGAIPTICGATGSTALTTTLTKYQLSCSVPSAVTLTSANPFWLYVGANWYGTTIKQSVQVQVYFEGTLNGNYDSQVAIPEVLAPVINSVSPTSGLAGTSVTIGGSYFGTNQGMSTLTFNGVAASPTSWSDISIVAPVPANATTGPVVVMVSGQASNGITFTVPPPNISSLSPVSGNPGTQVTISGSYFGSTQGTSTVTFNGATATPTSWSDSTIVTTVPVNGTTGPVVVTRGGQASNGITFIVPPYISTPLSPNSGPVGTSVNITGSRFGATQGTSTVKFTGVTAAVVSWNDTSVVAYAPSGVAIGPGAVVVTVAGGTSNSVNFTTTPGITRVSPSVAPIGTVVNIRGTNFGSSQGASTLTFNGIAAAPAGWTGTSIVAPVPSGVTTGPVIVTVGGYASNSVTFTISASISDVSPISGGPGTSVTITGLNLGATQGTSTVQFDGLPATPTSWSNTSIVVPVPTGALSGLVTVTVGGVTTNGIPFTVTPTISSISPTSGSGGTPVNIAGSNFGATQGPSRVSFNGTPAIPTSWSNTKIVAPVPATATNGPVVVTVNNVPSNGVSFTLGLGAVAGIVSRASNGRAVSGALVQALQTNTVIGSTNTGADGSYLISSLAAGSYDLRVTATGLGTAILSGNAVTANATTTVNAALSSAGTLSGKVAQSDGITAINGATVTATQGSTTAGAATTDSAGNYSIATLSAGSYSVQASVSGFTAQTQNGVAITAGNTTTVNFSLPGQSLITYTYDELGRLVGAVDSLSDAVTYNYDAVGNLLSITRNHSSQVSIIDFTPKSGPLGSSVTISGTGFSTAPAQDAVSFHGTSATVTSATATQLVTIVASGTTSGTITVTTPSGTATSTSAFTITSGSIGAPTITSFTPASGVPGTLLTVTGTNFDTTATNDKVNLNLSSASVSSATATSISTNVPNAVASGRISVSTSKGTAVSTQDFFVPFGTHVAADIGFTGRMSVNTTQSVSIGTAGKIGLLLFDGTQGQKISIVANSGSFGSCTLLLFDPYGQRLGSAGCTGNFNFIDAQALLHTGTYTIGIDPASTTGSVSISLYAFDNITGTLTSANPVTVNIAYPGQNAIYTFSGTAGQRASADLVNWTPYPPGGSCYEGTLSFLKPDGSMLSTANLCYTEAFIDAVTLPTTGTYELVFDPGNGENAPYSTGTGTLTLSLFADLTGTLTSGNSVAVNIAYPGQNAIYTFSGTAGQRTSVNLVNWTPSPPGSSCYEGTLTVFNPDGSTLKSANLCYQQAFVDAVTLPVTGTYKVVFDPGNGENAPSTTGTATLTLYLFADVTGTLTSGSSVAVNIAYPGQNASYTFSGTAGQRASANLVNWPSTGSCYEGTLSVVNPDGSTLKSANLCYQQAFVDAVTLPVTGTYKVVFDPGQDAPSATGTATLTLYLFADVTGTLTSGNSVAVNIAYPGQNAIYTFSGTASQRATVTVTNWTVGGCYTATLSILNPDGSTLSSVSLCGPSASINAVTLPTTGTYQIVFNPAGTNTGTANVGLTLQ